MLINVTAVVGLKPLNPVHEWCATSNPSLRVGGGFGGW